LHFEFYGILFNIEARVQALPLQTNVRQLYAAH